MKLGTDISVKDRVILIQSWLITQVHFQERIVDLRRTSGPYGRRISL